MYRSLDRLSTLQGFNSWTPTVLDRGDRKCHGGHVWSATNTCSGSVKPEVHQEICANSVAHSQLRNEGRLGLIMQPLPWILARERGATLARHALWSNLTI